MIAADTARKRRLCTWQTRHFCKIWNLEIAAWKLLRMHNRLLLSLSDLAILAVCTAPRAQQQTANLVTEFYDMSDSKFSVRAIAPPNALRELAICKAVWFAEKKNVRSISMGNPAYSPPQELPSYAGKVPADWVVLTATAYITAPNPDRNPSLDVAQKAQACRSVWPWYR
ncbi:MAG: hypothetical protein WDN49_17410 [Acetobacteraceae bacterium]